MTRTRYTLAEETALLAFLNTRKARPSAGNATGIKQLDWKAAAALLNKNKPDDELRSYESYKAKYRQVRDDVSD